MVSKVTFGLNANELAPEHAVQSHSMSSAVKVIRGRFPDVELKSQDELKPPV